MSVITISKGSFSSGKKLAECVARKLKYRCIDRDVLVQRTSIRSVSPGELFAALETPPAGASCLNHRKYIYLALVQAAILEEVSTGNAVYHGLAGQLLLPEWLALLRVRVIAPMEDRIQAAQEGLKVSREQARAHVEKVDEQRGKWIKYLYGVDWEDPSLYDLVINLEHLSIERACNVICGLIKEGSFKFSAKHQAEIDDFVLATRVRAALAKDPLTSNLELDVKASAGEVTIAGELCEQTEEIQRVAATVPKLMKLKFEEAEMASKA